VLDLSGCTRYRKRPALTCLAHQLVLGLSFPFSGVDGQYSREDCHSANNPKTEQKLGGDTYRTAAEFAVPGQHRRAV